MARKQATETTDTTAEDVAAIEAILNGEDIVTDDVDDAALAEALAEDDAVKAEAYEGGSKARKGRSKPAPKAKASAPEGEAPVKATRAPKLPFADAVRKMFEDDAAVFDSEDGELTEAQLDALIGTITQKKVQEKVVNLLSHVLGESTKLSNYTQIAVGVLVKAYLDDCANVTVGQIREAYEAAGYKAGTVNAQAGQMMSMFPSLGMATRTERGTLTPNKNSVILDALASAA